MVVNKTLRRPLKSQVLEAPPDPEDGVTMFHQGLFWRCFFTSASSDFSILDFWITGRSESKTCQPAFLFPFPAPHPALTGFPSEPYQPASAIVFRTFWSIFLVSGVTAVVIGGLLVLCAAPLTNRSLYSAGGALHVCGGAGHPGAVRRPSARPLRLPVLPAQCPAGPVLPLGARRRLPLPAGRTPLHPGGARRSGDPLGPNHPRPVRNRAVMSVSSSTNSLGQKLNCSIN
ncbi:transmembrane protein 182-like isoform X3 [Gambusia affinis]|uniref:transmembrane protein 182-like isoform X3 n=1 Tax=Gambusia affinis TaxID=33528 RepID=UPI001CDD1C6F|nr:transmembrane protein 182-like isoform X3 [Gambusia affinis]